MSSSNLTILHTERTEDEIIEALKRFAMTSAAAVGVNKTYDVLEFITKLIGDSPDMYRKITDPKTIEEFQKIIASNAGKKPNPLELMGMIGPLIAIFK